MRVWIGLVSLVLLLLLSGGSASAAPPARSTTGTGATSAAGSGVRIQCTTEGAELYLDGELMGQTPFKEVIPLSSGEHTIRVSRLGFTPYIDVFKVKAGQTTRIEVDLTPISGVLGVTSSTVKDGPAVRVFIDDKFFGKAPLETEVPLGNHQVRVERPGYYSETFSIKSEPGKRIDKDVDLKPLPADQNPYLVKQPQVKWYQKWWVWTIAAVGVAAVATAIIVPVVLSQRTICTEVDVCTTIDAAALSTDGQPQSLLSSPVQPLLLSRPNRPQLVPSLTLRF